MSIKKITGILIITLAGIALSAQDSRDTMPKAGEPKPFYIGDYYEFQLDNGLYVFYVKDDKISTLTTFLNFNMLSLTDDPEIGTRNVLKNALQQGTELQNLQDIQKDLKYKGGFMTIGLGSINGTVASEEADKAFSIIREAIFHPNITPKSIENAINKEIESLAYKSDYKPSDGLGKVLNRVIYKVEQKDTQAPKEEDLKSISADQCKTYFRKVYSPNNAQFLIVGDLKPAKIKKLCKKYLGDWQACSSAIQQTVQHSSDSLPPKREIYIVDKPGAAQSTIRLYMPLQDVYPYSTTDRDLKLLNMVLGEKFSSRLNQNLRSEKGLTYGCSSRINANSKGGELLINTSVRTEKTEEALENIYYELSRIRNSKIEDKELQIAKNMLIGEYARSFDGRGFAYLLAFALSKANYDIPDDYLVSFPVKIHRLSSDDMYALARKYIHPYRCYTIIEGDISELQKIFEPYGDVTYYNEQGEELNP